MDKMTHIYRFQFSDFLKLPQMLGLVAGLFLVSCGGLQRETIIYESDFERGVPTKISNGKVEDYNGSGVLGRYSESGFTLRLEDLKKHDMVRISFDLYIHDTWEGSAAKPEGPDIWIMNIDGWSSIYTTFANGLCTDCTQAFPVAQPTVLNNSLVFYKNKPNSNAIKTDLPGACELSDTKGGTSMYRIVRMIQHTGTTLEVGCFAQLEHPDAENKNCNESWSVDNMKITAIEFR